MFKVEMKPLYYFKMSKEIGEPVYSVKDKVSKWKGIRLKGKNEQRYCHIITFQMLLDCLETPQNERNIERNTKLTFV